MKKLNTLIIIFLITSACKQAATENKTSNSPTDNNTDVFNAFKLNGSINFTIKPNSLINTNTANFTFNYVKPSNGGSNASSFKCAMDSNALAACTSPITINSILEGALTFNVKAYSSSGSVIATNSYSFSVDLTAPSIPTLTPSVIGSYLNSNALNVSMSSSDNLSTSVTYSCALESGTFANCQNPSSLSSLADGLHTFKAKAIDGAGNNSAQSSLSFTVDSIAPVVAFTTTPAASSTSTSANFVFNITENGSGLNSVQCFLDNVQLANCSAGSTNSLVNLVVANHVLKVTAIDKAANSSSQSFNFAVTSSSTTTTGGGSTASTKTGTRTNVTPTSYPGYTYTYPAARPYISLKNLKVL